MKKAKIYSLFALAALFIVTLILSVVIGLPRQAYALNAGEIVEDLKWGVTPTSIYSAAEFEAAWSAATGVQDAGKRTSLKLEADITIGEGEENATKMFHGNHVMLDLNGHVLTYAAESGSVFAIIDEHSLFYLTDGNKTAVNTITTGDGQTVTINGGVVTGGKGYYCTYNDSSKVYVGHTCGGGIYVNNKEDVFYMDGGTFAGNSAEYGGGVFSRDGYVYLEGTCRISYNTATVAGGGVYVDNSEMILAAGSPYVMENTVGGKANNISLNNYNKIKVIGALTEGAQIGITIENLEQPDFLNGFNECNQGDDPNDYFSSDQGYAIVDGKVSTSSLVVKFFASEGGTVNNMQSFNVVVAVNQAITVAGDTVTINNNIVRAIPAADYAFGGWVDENGTAVSSGTVTEGISVYAQFTPLSETTTVYFEAGENGSVSVAEADVRFDAAISVNGKVLEIGTASVEAIPDEGYVFVQWRDAYGKAVTSETKISAGMKFTATFTEKVITALNGFRVLDEATREYYAFEEFDQKGVLAQVTYNDGSTEYIEISELLKSGYEIVYGDEFADCLHVSMSGTMAIRVRQAGSIGTKSIGGLYVTVLPVSVELIWLYVDEADNFTELSPAEVSREYDGSGDRGKIRAVFNGADGEYVVISGTYTNLVSLTRDGNPVTNVKEVGNYVFSVESVNSKELGIDTTDYEFENNALKLEVTPIKVNLADEEVYKWTLAGAGTELRSDTIYVYEIDGEDKYFSDVQTDENGNELELKDSFEVVRSFIRYRGGEQEINLNNGDIPKWLNTDEERATVTYSGNTATETGRYTATATVQLIGEAVGNVYYYSENLNPARGMTIEIDNATGTATITKVWYVVEINNGLTDGNGGEYIINGWNFADESVSISAPELEHGDDALITFTLYMGNAATDVNFLATFGKDEFSGYINNSMPASNYVLKIAVGSYTDEENVKYQAFSRNFNFTVSAAALPVAEDKIKGETYTYAYDGDMHLYTGGAPAAELTYNRSGFWAQPENDKYYDTQAEISFKLLRWAESNDFLSESELDKRLDGVKPNTVSATTVKDALGNEVYGYKIYYRLTAKNYSVYGCNDSDYANNAYYFIVVIETAKIDVNGVNFSASEYVSTYNGEAQAFKVSGVLPEGAEVKYTIVKDGEEVSSIVDAGEYTVTASFVLASGYNSANYELVNAEDRTATVTIERAKVILTGVDFAESEYTQTYNGSVLRYEVVGTVPVEVEVSYGIIKDGSKVQYIRNAGTYTVTASFALNTGYDGANYEIVDGEDRTATVIIEKAVYEYDVAFENSTVTYTGNSFSIALTVNSLPEGVTYSYWDEEKNTPNYNMHSDAGTYVVYVYFTYDEENYEPIQPLHATLEIEAAEFDFSGIRFNENGYTADYDGNPHNVTLTNLPTGVTATYVYTYKGAEIENCINAGDYTVTATVSYDGRNTNYKAGEVTRETTLIINAVEYDFSGIGFGSEAYSDEYNGEPHDITLANLPAGVTATYVYALEEVPVEHCVSAGNYTVTATVTYDGSNANYLAGETTRTATLVITEKEYDLSQHITFTVIGSVAFNGRDHYHDAVSISADDSSIVKVGYTVTDAGGNTVTEIVNAGVYTVTATIELVNVNYKLVNEVETKQIEVTPIRINLADGDNYKWTLAGAGSDLRGGTVYVYDVDGTDAYFSKPLTDENGNELTPKDTVEVIRSIVRYRGAELTINLNNGVLPTLAGSNDARVSVNYGGNKGLATGVYTATATIQLTADAKGNYYYYSENLDPARGMTIEIDNENGTATITKVWYVVEIDNGLTDGNGNEYIINGWTFADESVLITAPALEHGNAEELITFTLYTGNTETAANLVGSFSTERFEDYINNSMPAMNYVLVVNVASCTADGETYQAFSRTFGFTVSAAATPEVTDNVKGKTYTYTYSGEIYLYSEETDFSVESSVVRSGIWADSEYDKYYATEVLFRLNRWGANAEFIPLAEMLSGGKEVPANVSQIQVDGVYGYKVYYRLTSGNYGYYGGDDCYFIVVIEQLEIDLNGVKFDGFENLTYTGENYLEIIQGVKVQGLPESVKATYTVTTAEGGTASSVINAGVYTLTARFTTDNNHSLVNAEARTLKVTVEKSDYDLSAIKFENGEFTYEGGRPFGIVITGAPEGVKTIYRNADGSVASNYNSQSNAGVYEVYADITLEGDNNHNTTSITLHATLTVNKAQYDVSAITFGSFDITYDGSDRISEIVLGGNYNASVVEVAYTFANAGGAVTEVINAGSYTVTATFTVKNDNYALYDSENKYSRTATFTVKKAEYDFGGVGFEKSNYTASYDGTAHEITLENLPEGLTAVYAYTLNGNAVASCVNAGTYTVTAKVSYAGSENYNGGSATVSATLTVNKAQFDVSGIRFGSFGELVYSGSDLSNKITVSGETKTSKSIVKVVYTFVYPEGETQIKNAGTYTVIAGFELINDNYTLVNDVLRSVTVSVVKADYDLSNVVFKNGSFPYDGSEHTITVSGTAPQGTVIVYTDENGTENYNVQTEAGVYVVIAVITCEGNGNYNPATLTLSAILTIKPVRVETSVSGGKDGVEYVDITSPNGFDNDLKLFVTIIGESEYGNYSTVSSAENIYGIYSVSLKRGETEVQPTDELIIKLLIPESAADGKFVIYLLSEGVCEEIQYTVKDGYAVVTSDKLGEFIFVAQSQSLVPYIIVLGVLSAVLAACLIAQIIIGKKSNSPKDKKNEKLGAAAPLFLAAAAPAGQLYAVIALACIAGILLIVNIVLLIVRKKKKQQAEQPENTVTNIVNITNVYNVINKPANQDQAPAIPEKTLEAEITEQPETVEEPVEEIPEVVEETIEESVEEVPEVVEETIEEPVEEIPEVVEETIDEPVEEVPEVVEETIDEPVVEVPEAAPQEILIAPIEAETAIAEPEEDEEEEEPEEEDDDNEEALPVSESDDEAFGILVSKDESVGLAIIVRYKKSFTAKLIQSSDVVKDYYTTLKNEVLKYEKTKSRISWNYDSINAGRQQFAKFVIRGKTLCLYLALDPDEYAETKYKVVRSHTKKYAEVPCLYRIKNARRLKYAQELIAAAAEKAGLQKGLDSVWVNYYQPYDTTESLVRRQLIKELVSEEDYEAFMRKYSRRQVDKNRREFISAAEVNGIIDDEIAMSLVEVAEDKPLPLGAKRGKKGIINVDTLSANFEKNEVVNLETLKAKRLIPAAVGFVKVLARGSLSKPLIVEAQDFSLEAIKMIALTGGKVKKV